VNRSQTSPRGNGAANQKLDKPRTDWLAWSLQMALGFVVGFGASFRIARLLWSTCFISFDQMFVTMAGVGICCGAFASYYGDQAWLGSWVFDPPGPVRTEQAQKWSIFTGIFGGFLVLAPIGIHLATGTGRSTGSSWELRIFTLVLAAIAGLVIFHGLRNGTGFWRNATPVREEAPLCFWLCLAFMAIGLLALVFRR